jgi:hypothetical protein
MRSVQWILIAVAVMTSCTVAASEFAQVPCFVRNAEPVGSILHTKSSRDFGAGASWRSHKGIDYHALQSRGLDMLRFCAIAGMNGTPAIAIAGLLALHTAAPMTLVLLAVTRSGLFLARGIAGGPVPFVVGASRLALSEGAYLASRYGVAGAIRAAAVGGGVAAEEFVCGGLAGTLLLMGHPTESLREHMAAESMSMNTQSLQCGVAGASLAAASKDSKEVASQSEDGGYTSRHRVWRRRHLWA